MLFVPTQYIYGSDDLAEDPRRSSTFIVFEENGKVGLKDEEGEVLIPATYDAIGWSNGKLSIVDKVVGYQSNGLWGLINTSNKLVTSAEFLDLKPGEGSFLVAQKKSALSQRPSFGIVNTSGKTIIPFQYDGLHLSNMRAVVMSRTGTRYHFGLIDLSNKVLIPIQYQRIYSLGSLRYAVENFEDKTAIFSDEGNQVTTFSIDSISAFKKDYAIVYQNQRQGLMDRNGHVILKPTYGAIQLKDDGTIQVREIDSWFFLNGDNKLVREFGADGLKALSPDHYAVLSAGKIRLTNNDFKPLHETFFSSLTDFRNGIAVYRKSARTGVITSEGEVLIPAEYHQLIIDQNVFLASIDIHHKNRWVILDSQGKTITEKHYEYLLPFNGKFYPVRNRNYWGAVNADGKEIITCVHDSLVQ
ncbi:MAG TPA: WG repeat-containing protein, partial [Flavitalea sp.]|nr:WG repeat-containing protein [Flavitalea sp.]